MTGLPRISLRELLVLAWPIVISRSTQVVMGLGDALMVSHLGERGIAATTAGAFNTYMLIIFPMGIVFVVSSFASQHFGAGDFRAARRYGVYGLGVSVLTQLLCIVAIPTLPFFLGLLAYEPEVARLMYQYLWIRLLSGGAAIGIEALSNYYGGIGNTRLPMAINIGAMALDLLGNWMLIAGHWGAPAMGVAGAALSTTLSTWLWCFVFIARFWKEKGSGALGLKVSEFIRLFRFGIPSGLNWFFEFFAFNLFVNVILASLGTTALAAFMSVMQINAVAFMPAFAVASAGAILVGQAIGAGKKEEVPRAVRLTWATAGSWQGLVSLVYGFIPTLLLEPFANEETRAAGFLLVGARMLRLSAAWQIFDATCSTFAECLRAAGDTTFTMWARIVLAWVFFTPGAWICVRVLGMGDVVAVSWVVAYIGALAIILWLRFRWGAWEHIQLIQDAPAG